MSAMAAPWITRAAILIRASAGIMLILGLSAFAGAALVGGLIGVCVQLIVGGMGIVYAVYLRDLSENMKRLRTNQALITATVNMLGLPSSLIYFFPLHMPLLKIVTVLMFIGIGIASVVSLAKAKADEAYRGAQNG